MAKAEWMIVKSIETGEYYPAMMDRDLKWVSSKEGFVNQNGETVEVVYDLGKVDAKMIDPLWAAFRRGLTEGKSKSPILPYVVLQKDKTRYTYHYDKRIDKYDEKIDTLLLIGGTSYNHKISIEEALQTIGVLKEKGFLEFRNPRQVSWYATVENNTPYPEVWEKKNGFLIPIESHSVGVFTVQGCSCEQIDEWEDGKDYFILGNAIEDREFYYAFEKHNRQMIYEFDHRPSRDEVEDSHIDFLAKQAIDLHEAEFGADGYRAFPDLHNESKTVTRKDLREDGQEKKKAQLQILTEVLELAKNELKEAEDSIGYTMPDGKHHLFIYVDDADEKLYVVEPNRVENGAHEPFTGDTYLVKYGDFGQLMIGCMWAMECFERDNISEKEWNINDDKNQWLKNMVKEEFSLNNGSHGIPDAIKEILLKDEAFIGEIASIMKEYMVNKDLNEHDALEKAFNESLTFLMTEYGYSDKTILLKDFLHYFDFDYNVIMPDEPGEIRHRESLMEVNEIIESDLNAPMLSLRDLQGANLGDIESDRFRLDENLAERIIDRMGVYVSEVENEFDSALRERNVDISSMAFEEKVRKARQLGVDTGEVSYRGAQYILHPEMIDVSDIMKVIKRSVVKESLDEKLALAAENMNQDSERTIGKGKELER